MSLTLNQWSDGFNVQRDDGALPEPDPAPYPGDVAGFRVLGLPENRVLCVWSTWSPSVSGGWGPNFQDWCSARVLGPPVEDYGMPEAGPAVTTVTAQHVADAMGVTDPDLGQYSDLYVDAPTNLIEVSEGRYLVSYAFSITSSNQANALVLLAVDDLTVTVLDRWYLTDPWPYKSIQEYLTKIAPLGGGKAAVFYARRDEAPHPDVYSLHYRIIDVTADTLAVGAEQSGPLGNIGGFDCDVWCNGTVGVALRHGASAFPYDTGPYVWPFTVNGDEITFAAGTRITCWTGTAVETFSYILNDGYVHPGPGANQFIVNSNDQFVGVYPGGNNEYTRPTVLETDGVNVWVVDQALEYNDTAGFSGNPARWLPSTTWDGKMVGLYDNGFYGESDGVYTIGDGSHGHYHGANVILLYDMLGKETYDEVTEMPMPWYDPELTWYWLDWGSFAREIAATDLGVWVAVSMYMTEDPWATIVLVGWVPFAKPEIDGEPLDNRRRFATGR